MTTIMGFARYTSKTSVLQVGILFILGIGLGGIHGSNMAVDAKLIKGQAASKASKTVLPKAVIQDPPKQVIITATSTVNSAATSSVDLLHQIVFPVTAYHEATLWPEKLEKAETLFPALEQDQHLLVHMEAFRRASKELNATEQERLLKWVFQRQQLAPENVVRFFDQGYGQIVLKNNKTGLFFLRKANDRLKNQFTSLAYALAEADVDLGQEASSPAEMTMRKLDVTYKLIDAVTRDSEMHQPGFWPAFADTVDRLSGVPAYADFTRQDFSQKYLPYGKSMAGALEMLSPAEIVARKSSGNASGNAIDKKSGKSSEIKKQSATNKLPESLTLLAEAVPEKVMPGEGLEAGLQEAFRVNWVPGESPFYLYLHKSELSEGLTTGSEKSTKEFWLYNAQKQPLCHFSAGVNAYQVVEDLDANGIPELVVRQYASNKRHPLHVYRYQNGRFELDAAIEKLFE
ncbi:MAG: hypothetical protein K2X01_06995 [Cyanobacteria bacterium]|nr:hypothetical protein [Cyanobacteriota bacterium]